jgi:hypothetical protein
MTGFTRHEWIWITSMKIVRFFVTLRIPDNMTAEQAQHDLTTSIGFGRPTVICKSIVENVPDTQGAESDGEAFGPLPGRYLPG